MNKIACRKIFTETLLSLALENRNIIAITSDARGSVTLNRFADTLPDQFVETGIAEQNEVGIAAGLAVCGKIPFVCAPAPFLSSRSLEQVKVDVAYSNTNVKLIGVSGGISYGALGSSHHALHDIAVMRAIHGLTVLLPCDARQTEWFTRQLAKTEGPFYMRMGREPVPDVYSDETANFEIGKANRIREGKDLTIIATGEMVYKAMCAADKLLKKNIHARVLDIHTIKPLDASAIVLAAEETGRIITVEEHIVHGGLGAAVAETISEHCPVPLKILGVPDEHVIPGEPADVLKYYGLDPAGIIKSAEEFLCRTQPGPRK